MATKHKHPLSVIAVILAAKKTSEKHLDFMPEGLSQDINEKLRKIFSIIDFEYIPQVGYNVKTEFKTVPADKLEPFADQLLKAYASGSDRRAKNAYIRFLGQDFRGQFTPGSDVMIPHSLKEYFLP